MRYVFCGLLAVILCVSVVYADDLSDVAPPEDMAVADSAADLSEDVPVSPPDIDGDTGTDPDFGVVDGGDRADQADGTLRDTIYEAVDLALQGGESNVIAAEAAQLLALPSSRPLAGGTYFEVDTSQLGECLIYIPVDYQRGSFTYYGSNLFNLRSATITGILYAGNTSYSVRWSAFSTPTYRVGSNYNYEDLTVTEVLDTNIEIVQSDDDLALSPDNNLLLLVIVLCLGVLIVCRFMRL